MVLLPPEKISEATPWAHLHPVASSAINYHMAPEIFVSQGTKGSIVEKWVNDRGGIGGIHHLAYQVDSVADELEAVRLSWQVDGVRSVLNEIDVGSDLSLMDSAGDLVITTKIRASLMFDGDIFAINYSVETVNGTVHLMGIAQNEGERNRVIAHARDTSYVKRVVSHIRLKDDANRQGT